MLVSVIIPVFNEARHIAQVIDSVLAADVRPHRLEVIVSNDASTDDTLTRLAPYAERVKLLSSARNEGKASAIRRAMSEATGEVILIQDADLEYSPLDYPALIAPIAAGQADAVYGSRFLNKSWPDGMRADYWLANKVFTWATNLLYGARITDEGTAYKAFRAGLLREIGIASSGFEFCPEVTAKLLLRGTVIAEAPVRYRARGRSEGKKPGFMDGVRVLWTIVRLRFARG